MTMTRGQMSKQITKGTKMPKGIGTYGSKVGRPPKKKKMMGGGAMKKSYAMGGMTDKKKMSGGGKMVKGPCS